MRFSDSRWRLLSAAASIALIGAWAVLGQTQGDPLLRGFQNPPDSAKPRVWWHWMSGNITKVGIKADLEWMKRVGIAGFQNFDAGLNSPQIVEKRLVYMTPEWKDAFKYATTLADQLGLEMAIAGSPGWSESGGPWVPPSQAMKKYVWSETRIEGGRPFNGILPKPPSATGAYQNQAGGGRGGRGGNQAPPPEFYADAVVVAYRAPESDRAMSEIQPKISSSGGSFDVGSLTSGDLSKSTLLPAAPVGERAWIQYEFAQPQTFRGLTFVTAGGGGGGFGGGRGGGASNQQLEASDDGNTFRDVAPIPGGARTIAFPAVTARFFRVSVLTPQPQAQQGRGNNPGGFGGPPGGGQGGRAQAPAAPAGTQISEFLLHGAVVNRFQEKAAFSAAQNIYTMATPTVPAADAVRKADVIDLTAKMRPDGTLDWTPSAGRWVVLRIGYSLTGHQNSPASPEATGLEVDKLNRGYVKAYFDNYLNQYKDATGGLMGKRGLQYMITDSWEAGTANWTDDMMAEFNKRRGYDMKPWIPALAGHVVESAEATDRFLWDFRRTLEDLVAENHYDQLTQILKERGMARYSESHESGRAFIADGMEVKRTAAVPMSAMWTNGPGRANERYDADVRESASVAHIYGQNLVAAESLTANGSAGAWAFSPETLKPTADRELSMGLNRFVIHCSVHQATDDKIPGLGLGPFGQWFNRHETWAEQAKPWTTYLARSSYMLQQGKFVADIAYYYGEDSNITALFAGNPPPIPAGYGFDYVNSDVLLKLTTVAANGNITTPSGMSYRILALDPNSQHMPLAVLRKIRDMVAAGATVVGPKPIDSPSLHDDEAEFKTIEDQVWGAGTGKGKVFGTGTIEEALTALNLAPDFEYSRPQPDTELAFVHRKLNDGDVYWVSHRNTHSDDVEATFRAQGKAPEFWRADTGAVEPASYRIERGRTIVALTLNANDAVFVVFRKAATAPQRSIAKPVETQLTSIQGSWEVSFQPNRGAPAKVTLSALASWHENSDTGVKYFSGTGTYTNTIQAPAEWFQTGARLWIDLGDVKNIAEVAVNGKALGTFWRAPFRVDVTSALKPGANTVEIKVTNLWVNRLIGDQQPGVTQKLTYTAQQFYRADSPLLPSGLIGPV
ncbi:MAG TPA: glycosyl hydrolase, partial [Bryobacteraceae bacterium]|nr:glycosyl hydrolase [Bryobacteraceae bacterium]